MSRVVKRFGLPLSDGLAEYLLPFGFEVLNVYVDDYGLAMDVIVSTEEGSLSAWFHVTTNNVELPPYCRWATWVGSAGGRHVFELGGTNPETR